MEAVDIGARLINFWRIPLTDPSAWIILRHPDALTAEQAAICARALAFKKYGMAAALRSKLPLRFKNDPFRLFCSQLVAVAYERAGAPIVEGKASSQITPRLLHEKSALKPLQYIPISPVISLDGTLPELDRDAGYTASLNERELRAAQNAFQAVKDEMMRLIEPLNLKSPPGSLSDLIWLLRDAIAHGAHQKVAHLTQSLEQALEQEGYFDLFQPFLENSEANYARDLAFAKSDLPNIVDRKAMAGEFAALAAALERTRIGFDSQARLAQTDFEKSGARLWSRIAEMSRENARKMPQEVQSAHESKVVK
jgi:hypothetical protein